MTVQCLSCVSLDLQSFKAHAKQGFGRCPYDPVGVFVGIRSPRECSKFKPAGADIVAARVEWAAKL